MEYFTRKVKTPVEEGLQVWVASHGYARPVDGEKIYPSRQNAYPARDRLQKSITWIDCKITIRVEQKDFEQAVNHIEATFPQADVLVCLPYKDAFYQARSTPVVDVIFRYMCRPPDFTFTGTGSRFYRTMTYEELASWLKEADEILPAVQGSTIEVC
jgi:hypothetical protein